MKQKCGFISTILVGLFFVFMMSVFENSWCEEETFGTKPRIGILTSGGDCAGLNAVIYAAYHVAQQKGYDVVGFRYGAHGIVNNDYVMLNDKMCNPDILNQAGSILKCNTKEMRKDKKLLTKEETYAEIIKEYHRLNLHGLIYVGGDGSIGIMKHILKRDPTLQIVAVPKTIDNDIANTDVALGFSTVSSVVKESIKDLMSTIRTHERIAVVEVMGRAAGYIALHAGLANAADVILIPEHNYDMKEIYKRIEKTYAPGGKRYFLIVVAEAVEFANKKYAANKLSDALVRVNYGGIAEQIAQDLKKKGWDAKSLQLGHVQRGGTPTVEDRILGQKFGSHAVELIQKQKCKCQLGFHNGKIIETPLMEIQKTTRELSPDDDAILLANSLGIYIGTPKGKQLTVESGKNASDSKVTVMGIPEIDAIRKKRRNRIFRDVSENRKNHKKQKINID